MENNLDFSSPIIMGILNVTPDSFSDGGAYPSTKSAVDRALIMIEQGAKIIDIGGESTKPGSERVPPIEQKRRIIDVISQLKKVIPSNILISVDTTSSEVAQAAIDLGVEMINDVSGGTDDEKMMPLIAQNNLYYCIMHMQGSPKTMQDNPTYENVIEEIKSFFLEAKSVFNYDEKLYYAMSLINFKSTNVDFRLNILYADPSPINYLIPVDKAIWPEQMKDRILLNTFNLDKDIIW